MDTTASAVSSEPLEATAPLNLEGPALSGSAEPTELEPLPRRLSVWLVRLAWVLALGGVIAALYWLWPKRQSWRWSSEASTPVAILVTATGLGLLQWQLDRRRQQDLLSLSQQQTQMLRQQSLETTRERYFDSISQWILNRSDPTVGIWPQTHLAATGLDLRLPVSHSTGTPTSLPIAEIADSLDLGTRVARARTLAVLSQQDASGRGAILQFLYTSELVAGERPRLPLSYACLNGVQLREAYLKEINLNDASLLQADLSRAYLREAHLIRGQLAEAQLPGANLWHAVLWDTNLSYADLQEASLVGADLSRADLSEANLHLANLHSATLWNALLRGADLSGAQLGGSIAMGANFRGADLTAADLVQANLSDADLSEASLCGADLRDADLIRANLSGADLTGANLSRADLDDADLSDTCLDEVDITATHFGKVRNLSQANRRCLCQRPASQLKAHHPTTGLTPWQCLGCDEFSN